MRVGEPGPVPVADILPGQALAAAGAGRQPPAPVKAEFVLHDQPVTAGVVGDDHAAAEQVPVNRGQEFPVHRGGGFLRITGGAEPLDASSVHPEAYPVARKIRAAAGGGPAGGKYAALNPQDFVDGSFGLPTVQDIIAELEKPGRDPRPAFAAATFSEGIEKISDLRPGMVLEGTVTNVAAFGAFVDVGVHQDGLVHVSALANRFVADPREVVKSGQVVRVKVLEADPERKRISLTLRQDDEPATPGGTSRKAPPQAPQQQRRPDDARKPGEGSLSPARCPLSRGHRRFPPTRRWPKRCVRRAWPNSALPPRPLSIPAACRGDPTVRRRDGTFA
ncbi:MAG: RNA-binding transcriptional accessory protein [Arthrobacter sp.]|nr:RNA-binding transcriptional accessory protein [Arthrobacter sp.]